ncbi:hypothetical protein [Candidatus Venteria ishoeyi]|uniref:Uncharacterized protein n=1 Tax=Candidatus Venteria ishoeyi TaxID=1899563 RepID=A0A1H6F853_9GAMM|nr:hypothetical protein [Candidatus Venteria ishoeyi]SEH05145.1 Uncharacterised protein [Candidatus Venteria ishoeyi]
MLEKIPKLKNILVKLEETLNTAKDKIRFLKFSRLKKLEIQAENKIKLGKKKYNNFATEKDLENFLSNDGI